MRAGFVTAEQRGSRSGGWRLMRAVSTTHPRLIVLGVGAALGWTVAKIAIPLMALEAIDHGLDPYDGATIARWSLLIVLATLVVGAFTFGRRYCAFAISL